jgi:8-oxo-dGTP pyrophosphatase MutT (NUDIX family)/transcriptional regulator with XRE-family HTH domain
MPPAPLTQSYADLLARNLRAARAAARISQAEVAGHMNSLGCREWRRQTVARVERAERKMSAEEVFWLAYVLDTSVTRLMSPTEDDHWVAAPNGRTIHAQHARQRMRSTGDGAIQWDGNTAIFMVEKRGFQGEPGTEDLFAAGERQQPVVATIVVCDRRVLVGRRNDGKPPWTFIAGEQEPGERPEDTAIREVKEETGLRVQVGHVVGERINPKTHRRMIYLTAHPTHGADAFVGDSDELAEVRWVDLAEVDDLLPGMFRPVREYLAHELDEGESLE